MFVCLFVCFLRDSYRKKHKNLNELLALQAAEVIFVYSSQAFSGEATLSVICLTFGLKCGAWVKNFLAMAEVSQKRSRIITLAVDQSEWSMQALECK